MHELLLANLDEAYEKKAWHGPNLRGALRGLDPAAVVWRPAPRRHNIWELTAHAAYWKYIVWRRLTGAKRGSFALQGSDWMTTPDEVDEGSWRELVRLLDGEHRRLRECIVALRPDELRDAKKRRLVYGVAAHDLYHTGQIQLLKRLRG